MFFDAGATMEVLAGMFLVGLTAGTVDAIAGGGGLITLPAVLFLGVPPVQALGTTKIQSTAGVLSASIHFFRSGQVELRALLPAMAYCFAAASLGAFCVQYVDAAILTAALPPVFALVALYYLLSPRVGDGDSRRRIGDGAFARTAAPAVGFYDGLLGPGTGSFYNMAFVALLGFNIRKATANTKVLNLTSNAAALLFFVAGENLVWSIGLAMAAGQLIGGRLGAGMVMSSGVRLIRPLIVLACLGMIMKMRFAS